MGSTRVGAALGAALLTLVAGCSNKEQGTPVAAGSTTSTTSRTSSPPDSSTPSTSSSTTAPSVTRPKAIDLKTTTSCKILNAMPAAEFGWSGDTPREGDSLAFPGTRDCVVSGTTSQFGFDVTAVTTQGVAEYTQNGQGLTPITAAGFPGFTFSRLATACTAIVDVADGQMLHVVWTYLDTKNIPPKETLCANAAKGATGAMKALGAS